MAKLKSKRSKGKPAQASPPGERAVHFHQIEEAIDNQRCKLWEAAAIVESVTIALRAHFGGDWPANVPEFSSALGAAVRTIKNAADDLEMSAIETAALASQGVNS